MPVGGAYALLNFGSGRGSNLCEALEVWPLAYPCLFAGVEKPCRATVAIMSRRAAASRPGPDHVTNMSPSGAQRESLRPRASAIA